MSALDQNYRKTERIAIAGRANLGKTEFARKIADKAGVPMIKTDDFIDQASFEESPIYIMEHLNSLKGGYVVVGVQVARMLKKGLESGLWQPDTVILVDNPYSVIQRKHAGIASMNKRAIAAWKECCSNDIRVIHERLTARANPADRSGANK